MKVTDPLDPVEKNPVDERAAAAAATSRIAKILNDLPNDEARRRTKAALDAIFQD